MRFTTAPNVTVARKDFIRTDPRVRVLFTNGGGSAGPGAFQPVWTAGFSSWPPTQAAVTTFDLGTGGALASAPAKAASTVTFRPTPTARPSTDIPGTCPTPNGNQRLGPLPCYDWAPVTGTEGLGFTSPVLTKNVVVVGPASLNLEVKSTARDTDLQATVSEVMPTGQEMYVTSGFLRASDRALHPPPRPPSSRCRPTWPGQSSPCPRGTFTLVRIPIDPIGFAFRAGSRIRVTLSAPGGDRPSWEFHTYKTHGAVTDTVALGGAAPSSLVLGVVPKVTPPNPQPACPSLRGQPCRAYVPAGNGG